MYWDSTVTTLLQRNLFDVKGTCIPVCAIHSISSRISHLYKSITYRALVNGQFNAVDEIASPYACNSISLAFSWGE